MNEYYQNDGEIDSFELHVSIPNISPGFCNNLGVTILDFLMSHYPPYFHKDENGNCKWLWSILTFLFTVVSFAFTISLVGSLFDFNDETFRQKAHQEGLPYNFIIFFLHLSLAVIDKFICAYYFFRFDGAEYLDLDRRDKKEKACVAFRSIICIIVWAVFFGADCYLSLGYPPWPYFFDWDMSWIVLLILFHIFYHLPAILSQNVMNGDILQEQCYLNHISDSLTNLSNHNNNNLTEMDEYFTKYKQFEKRRKILQWRSYCILAYTTTDILLIILYIAEPMLTVSLFGYGLYIGFHTLYSAIPFMDFMWTASQLGSTHNEAIGQAEALRSSHPEDATYQTLNNFITGSPMCFYLFYQRVSWVGMAVTIGWFIIAQFFLTSFIMWMLDG